MHPFSVLTLGIFVAGYITARWDLVTRLYELAIFAWDHGVVVSSANPCVTCMLMSMKSRATKGFAVLTIAFFVFVIPIDRIAARETTLVGEIRPSFSPCD